MKEEPLIKVAYADDHALVRKSVISYVEQLGGVKVIIEAIHGKDLIEQLEHAAELPEVALLDINMPVMDGFDTTAIIKNRWPDMKVLALSAFDTEMYIARMIQLGADGYVLKSCDPEDIKQAIVSVYKTGAYYAPHASSRFFSRVKSGQVKLPHFTEHEIDFLRYCPSDLNYNEIAEKLHTTKKAVESCRDRLFDKLDVNSRTSLALYAVQYGLFPIYAKILPDKGMFKIRKNNGGA